MSLGTGKVQDSSPDPFLTRRLAIINIKWLPLLLPSLRQAVRVLLERFTAVVLLTDGESSGDIVGFSSVKNEKRVSVASRFSL